MNMLRQTANRAGVFGCFGLHEWAMVYQAESIRHRACPLRVTQRKLPKLFIRCESAAPTTTLFVFSQRQRAR